MSHDSSPKKLIYMANQIGKFFTPQGHDKAVAGIANHLTKFWDPSMREKTSFERRRRGLDPLVKEAVERVRTTLPTEAGYWVSTHLRRQAPRIPSIQQAQFIEGATRAAPGCWFYATGTANPALTFCMEFTHLDIVSGATV
jgi:formate dehydrogenase subunit delta